MNGLNQVKAALVARLQAAGLMAVGAFEDRSARGGGAVVAVEVAKATGSAMGLGSYLGTAQSPEGGSCELYGRRLEVVVSLGVYAPGGADACEAVMEQASEALLSGLPSGLRPGEVSWGETGWDKAEQRYVRRGTLVCTAYFTATVEPETGVLLDFILKGVMRSA